MAALRSLPFAGLCAILKELMKWGRFHEKNHSWRRFFLGGLEMLNSTTYNLGPVGMIFAILGAALLFFTLLDKDTK